jgi:hypothetical protein
MYGNSLFEYVLNVLRNVCRNPGLQPKAIDIDPDRIVLLVFVPFAITLNQVVIQIKIPLDVQEWS